MNVFELFAKLTLDTSEYESKLDDSEKKAGGFGDKLKAGLGAGAVALTAGVTAAATGISVLTNQAVNGYKEYEQLVGGVETLFGSSADTVQQYADNAYKTAGLSANQYMETVTSFSASLLQSLGGDTEAAAQYADTAITDMSDNANKMGTSMESIQNAYQGFAKQNYTMLDNLKLGYGGTKTEMERLISDAEKLNGNFKATRDENGKLTMSYADVVDAIHIVQQNMGITGTTALEASSTIQGSAGSMQAAWQNLVVGLANGNAEIAPLIDNLVASVTTTMENMIPTITQTLSGIGELITGLAPVITDAVPMLVTEVLPTLLEAATNLVLTIGETIISQLPTLIDVGVQSLMSFLDSFAQTIPELIPVAVEAILTICETLLNNLDQVIDAAIEIIFALADGLINSLPTLLEKAPFIVAKLATAIIENAPKLLESALQLVMKLVTGIISNLPKIGTAAGQLVGTMLKSLADSFTSFLEAGRRIVEGIVQGIQGAFSWAWAQVKAFFQNIVDGVKSALGIHSPSKVFAGIGKQMVAGLGEGWDDSIDKVKDGIEGDLDFSGTSPSISATGTAGMGGKYGSGGIMIHIDNMNVRSDNDIRQIAKQLYGMINQSARGQGIAGGVYA